MTARRRYLHSATVLVTQDAADREIADGALLTEDDCILALGTTAHMDAWIAAHPAAPPNERVDLSGCVLVPGLVNCHHHLYQSLTCAIGTGRGLALFDWLRRLYGIWAGLTPAAVDASTRLALAELLLTGATTVADHLYLFPNGCRLDDEIAAAQEMGVRFHAARGRMSRGESTGGLPPDVLVEREPAILADWARVIERWHDPQPRSMLRIALAPCSPFSVSEALMRETAALARSHVAVGLHTHLAETLEEDRYCAAHLGKRPLGLADSVGWTGPDVWFAHMVHPSAADIGHLARSGCGVCHCPTSNMILSSGIAPVRALLNAGVRVGLGVDGSASNDGNQLLAEARMAMVLQRVDWPGFESDPARFTAREALALATRGGARVLGRDNIGHLAPGMAADVAAFRIDGPAHAGGQGDPVAALVTCAPAGAWYTLINGQPAVQEGQLVRGELPVLIERHNQHSRALLARAGLA